MSDLSEDAKKLGIRYLIGDLTEVQFNFLCHQGGFDKEAILLYIQTLRRASSIFGFIIILLALGFFTLIYFFLFGGF